MRLRLRRRVLRQCYTQCGGLRRRILRFGSSCARFLGQTIRELEQSFAALECIRPNAGAALSATLLSSGSKESLRTARIAFMAFEFIRTRMERDADDALLVYRIWKMDCSIARKGMVARLVFARPR
jgi:hypothetical protein